MSGLTLILWLALICAICAGLLLGAAACRWRHTAQILTARLEAAERAASREAERALTLSSRLTAMEEASESLALSLQEARRESSTARLPRRRPAWPTNGGAA